LRRAPPLRGSRLVDSVQTVSAPHPCHLEEMFLCPRGGRPTGIAALRQLQRGAGQRLISRILRSSTRAARASVPSVNLGVTPFAIGGWGPPRSRDDAFARPRRCGIDRFARAPAAS